MTRILMILPLIAALPACTPAAQAPTAAQPAAPFSMPMDPGDMSCSSLDNPNALAAATDWTMGQLRANAMAGRISGVPDPIVVSNALVASCRANPASSLRGAANQIS